ncbi:nucleotide-binding universal stress UspA family protein [Sphingomonas vulcanisoli]|uniref:Nucleotide-binding universal stress UspA family protein n=1 Tax=Sphingomonas vulcanisoli TaxID=1658060 RepID=A0ABX0TY50_9SPHN|nr:universal stress protein [Sphingomonas vulcanisoli]NIJ09315.1 nucleotide-binding universal stress UspA family protein [Sphingomonas vulcanisoli]
MKTILLLVHDDAGQEARYQGAVALAHLLDAHLHCVDVAVVPDAVGDTAAFVDGGLMLAEERTRESLNKTQLTLRLDTEGVRYDWIDTYGLVRQSIGIHAALIDLIVLSTDAMGTFVPWMKEVIGDLLVELGKPILVMPPAADGLKADGRAMVAWDGSRDADAALRAAMPILQHAESVTLVYADDNSLRIPVKTAVDYLKLHGVEATIRTLHGRYERAGSVLVKEARHGLYDYAVMGGYGHSRALETLFGGATRTMLAKSPIPVLLVHQR